MYWEQQQSIINVNLLIFLTLCYLTWCLDFFKPFIDYTQIKIEKPDHIVKSTINKKICQGGMLFLAAGYFESFGGFFFYVFHS